VEPRPGSETPSSGATSARKSKGQVGIQLTLDLDAARKRRARFGPLPEPPAEIRSPYAKRHHEDFDAGEAIAWMMTRPEWEETIGAECDAVEAERPTKGPTPSYSTRELEGVLFFGVIEGIRTYRATRDRLAGDRGARARKALGFDQPRERRCPRELKLYAGVPSEATISRHRARFPYERRLAAYGRYFDRVRQTNAQDPELREGLRIRGMDGSAQPTSFTCPRVNEDGEIVNATQVTCPEGGYVGKSASPEKQGDGFAVVVEHCINQLPWSYHHGKIHMGEREAAMLVIEDFARNVKPYTGERFLSVLTADSNFQAPALRAALNAVDVVENIHDKSHAQGRESTDTEVKKANRAVLDIDGHPNWYANGHRELKCRCGKASIGKKAGLDERGAYSRAEGKCENCGRVSFTAGEYKVVRDSRRPNSDPRGQLKLRKVEPGDPDQVRDWQFGNPLTFNDLVAARYGDMRFGHGEGFNGTMVKRFKLLKTKGYYRTKAQAELHCVMVFAGVHALTMRQQLRKRAAASAAAGLAAAA
jgi:hypothetical protein